MYFYYFKKIFFETMTSIFNTTKFYVLYYFYKCLIEKESFQRSMLNKQNLILLYYNNLYRKNILRIIVFNNFFSLYKFNDLI